MALVAGSILLFPHASPALRLPWWAVVSAVVGTLLFFISIMTAALRARAARPPAGIEGLVGSVGLTRTNLVPDGEVTAAGSLWRARTLGAAIPEGTRVRVRSVTGLLLLVEGIGEEDATGDGDEDREERHEEAHDHATTDLGCGNCHDSKRIS